MYAGVKNMQYVGIPLPTHDSSVMYHFPGAGTHNHVLTLQCVYKYIYNLFKKMKGGRRAKGFS